ncbi:thymidylate synthase [Sphingobium boeckii]|uniref:Thymidylate synthase n=1 Tax=Sphingobium boeckii TaxID=1082345 RepID=A0A7W9ALY1_9SPHN|nr:thymidylate synthase [Sphingobium boeckii]MBB5687834.1 thymidylate synthase [Sphingobium boeckii]
MTIDAQPVTLEADNLSLGWGKVLERLTRRGVTSITPLTLTITGFNDDGVAAEVPEIRTAVEAFLETQDKRDSENVAWTIFPQNYWDLAQGDREYFFELYTESFQRVQDFNPRNNKRGSYFQRLVDLYGEGKGPNQLKWMLDDWDAHPKARRTSKFQATTFDPHRDYTSQSLLEFPCLQQVSFVHHGDTLGMNAFYASQQIARKAYGNYLGLARLGAFMAGQMGLRFTRLTIFVGLAQMDVGKTDPDLQTLLAVVRRELKTTGDLVAA